MNDAIVAGDIVTLKSGSPLMTVGDVHAGVANCYWFAPGLSATDSTPQRYGESAIAVGALQKVPEQMGGSGTSS